MTSTTETTTNVSEVVDACTRFGWRNMLWYFGVSIRRGKYFMFGDDTSMTNTPMYFSWEWQVWDQLKTLLFWKFDTGTTQVHGQYAPPSTERGVTDSTQDWIGNVSAPLLTWQSQKERSGSNHYPNVSVSVVTWHSCKKRQSRRNLELNFYTRSTNPEMTLALAFLSHWWNCIFESRGIFSHGCQEFLTTNDF